MMGKFRRERYLDYEGPEVRCKCGKRVPLITAWTDKNPGRRFYCCVLEEEEGGCGFWDWLDPKLKKPKYSHYCEVMKELWIENKKLMGNGKQVKKQSMESVGEIGRFAGDFGQFSGFGETSEQESGVHSGPRNAQEGISGELGYSVVMKLVCIFVVGIWMCMLFS